MALNNQSNDLSNLGRREDALAAITEIVALYRGLAAGRPDTFTPNVATSLNNTSNRLADLGRPEAALATATETVALTGGWPPAAPTRSPPTSPPH